MVNRKRGHVRDDVQTGLIDPCEKASAGATLSRSGVSGRAERSAVAVSQSTSILAHKRTKPGQSSGIGVPLPREMRIMSMTEKCLKSAVPQIVKKGAAAHKRGG
jgi:hypothetical protein